MGNRFFCDMCTKEMRMYNTPFIEFHLKIKMEQFYDHYDFGQKTICERCAEKLLLLFNLKPKHPSLEKAREIANKYRKNEQQPKPEVSHE